MNRFWAFLFLLVPVLGIASYLMAAFGIWPLEGLWLPDNYSDAGRTIDHLWNVIHIIGAVILLLTGLVLAIAIGRFGSSKRKSATYFSHNTQLEIVWSIIPGAILVFIALYQMKSWEENKLARPTKQVGSKNEAVAPLVRVIGRRFAWEFHHAGEDGRLDTLDDVIVENELVIPAHEDVVLELESRDVIHSFFVPNLRLKQDIVPGLKQLIWFNADRETTTTIICAELCGWGHYTMQASMKLVSRSDYEQWLKNASNANLTTNHQQDLPE